MKKKRVKRAIKVCTFGHTAPFFQRDIPFYTDDFLYEVLGVEGIPAFLYHYTSVDTFVLILKNRTIRFNRLDRVNDAEEAMAIYLHKANTTQFVSCWTATDAESIPLWQMYTRMTGIRIRLPVDMFKGRPKPEIYDHGGVENVSGENFASTVKVVGEGYNTFLLGFLFT